jgi:hypothetical protein
MISSTQWMHEFAEPTNCDLQSQKAQYVVLLSGTPALSRPIELFTQVNFVSMVSCIYLMLKSRVTTTFSVYPDPGLVSYSVQEC